MNTCTTLTVAEPFKYNYVLQALQPEFPSPASTHHETFKVVARFIENYIWPSTSYRPILHSISIPQNSLTVVEPFKYDCILQIVAKMLNPHPASIPPTNGQCPFLNLDDTVISNILIHADLPSARKVCHRFAKIEDTVIGRLEETIDTRSLHRTFLSIDDYIEFSNLLQQHENLQKRREQNQQKVRAIQRRIDSLPESSRVHFPSAHDVFLNPIKQTELHDALVDTRGDYPLTYTLIKKRLLPSHSPNDVNLGARIDAILSKPLLWKNHQQEIENLYADNVPLATLSDATTKWVLENGGTVRSLTLYDPKFLPEDLQRLPNLETLVIDRPKFSDLPSWFFGLPLTNVEIINPTPGLFSLLPKIWEMKTIDSVDFSKSPTVHSFRQELTSGTTDFYDRFIKRYGPWDTPDPYYPFFSSPRTLFGVPSYIKQADKINIDL
jgi:hypothetical protein